MAKTLIAYFSRADENYFAGAMRYVKVGNTEIVANSRPSAPTRAAAWAEVNATSKRPAPEQM